MVNVEKEIRGNGLFVRIHGSVDETTDFQQLIGDVAELTVNAREIDWINSIGVKLWVKYFQEQFQRGTRLALEECSPSVVTQLNLVRNFFPGTILSVSLQYLCTQCKNHLQGIMTIETLRSCGFEPPRSLCPKCGKLTAEFDDISSDYLAFAMRA